MAEETQTRTDGVLGFFSYNAMIYCVWMQGVVCLYGGKCVAVWTEIVNTQFVFCLRPSCCLKWRIL